MMASRQYYQQQSAPTSNNAAYAWDDQAQMRRKQGLNVDTSASPAPPPSVAARGGGAGVGGGHERRSHPQQHAAAYQGRPSGGSAGRSEDHISQQSGNRRFSYLETPVEMQTADAFASRQVLHRIPQSPDSPDDDSRADVKQEQSQPFIQSHQLEEEQWQRDDKRNTQMSEKMDPRFSHYNGEIAQPVQPHPAQLAPVMASPPQAHVNGFQMQPYPQQHQPQQQQPQQRAMQREDPGPIPQKHEYQQQPSPFQHQRSPSHSLPSQPAEEPRPDPSYTPYANLSNSAAGSAVSPSGTVGSPRGDVPIFSPDNISGPNGPPIGLHQPGQIAHPNMDLHAGGGGDSGGRQQWRHGLCECSGDCGTCLMGLFCPCVLYGRTAYRLEQRSKRKDPTDLLGWEKFNWHCGIMGAACGLWCLFPLLHRPRIRHAYRLVGSLGSDIAASCCCCCCALIQNEREVRDREENARRFAGPGAGGPLVGSPTVGGGPGSGAAQPYPSAGGMLYEPGAPIRR
ncbi:PLAC8 family-domain-containing protein [Lineolata rhizophorae]|uniref:PLAC8 family-domain-containing protein n=1 Tax=Lineolata rhizophorae TaxID=578093 RepID=A0A6A6NP96_9PEZI|nr:PLAC8 family-domain-containing protein [Lineolata rhizophorae]